MPEGFHPTLAENGAESESDPPPVAEKPAEVRAAGTIADEGDVNPAPTVFNGMATSAPRFRQRYGAAGGSSGRRLQVSEGTTSGFRQASRNAKRAGSLRPFVEMRNNG